MSTIGLGMIGAGHIAEFTARDFARHPGCTTVAVADPSTERAEALAGQIGCTSVHARADALLARHDVDAVYIAVPNALHESVATRALAAGKHVLLEKPFALSARQAEDIIAAAKRADRILMLGMNQRFERNVQRAKKLVDGGRLGDVYHVTAHVSAKGVGGDQSASSRCSTWTILRLPSFASRAAW
ncbi:MAG: Gfo/Idh/MocA family oxidoreductase [Gammaproteobacteria bacterium]